MPIARTSGQNRMRIAAVRKCIEILRDSPEALSIKDIAERMGASISAVKGYLWALLQGDVVDRSMYKADARHPYAVYTYCSTHEQAEAFMKTMEYDPTKAILARPKAPRSIAERLAKEPSRHVHLAEDDEAIKVRISKQRVMPYADLPREFFTSAQA